MENDDIEISVPFRRLFSIAGLAVCAVVFTYFLFHHAPPSGNHSRWGEFGDFFGGILNPIFGFLGFTALLYTIKLQSTELRLTRKELSNSSKALAAQNETLQHNNFENSFFQMLQLHNDIVGSVSMEPPTSSTGEQKQPTTGRDCFVLFHKRFRAEYQSYKSRNPSKEDREVLDISHSEYFKIYQTIIGHYYRYLVSIYRFVDESSIENKEYYCGQVTALLSDAELALLHYFSISSYSDKNIHQLIQQYAPGERLSDPHFFDESHRTIALMG